MVTGFNTDVEFNGCVYHVQTEDRGVSNPIIESLVYTGGEIVTSRQTSYAELLASGADPAEAILARMEAQHRDLMRAARNGVFAKGELKPFGHGIVTNRSFDEVVAEFLASDPALLEAAAIPPAPPGETDRAPAPVVAPAPAGMPEADEAEHAAVESSASAGRSEGRAPARRGAARRRRSPKRS